MKGLLDRKCTYRQPLLSNRMGDALGSGFFFLSFSFIELTSYMKPAHKAGTCHLSSRLTSL